MADKRIAFDPEKPYEATTISVDATLTSRPEEGRTLADTSGFYVLKHWNKGKSAVGIGWSEVLAGVRRACGWDLRYLHAVRRMVTSLEKPPEGWSWDQDAWADGKGFLQIVHPDTGSVIFLSDQSIIAKSRVGVEFHPSLRATRYLIALRDTLETS